MQSNQRFLGAALWDALRRRGELWFFAFVCIKAKAKTNAKEREDERKGTRR